MTSTRRGFLKGSAGLGLAYVLPWSPALAQNEGVAPLLTWIPHADLSVVDPLFSTSMITQIFAAQVFDTLFGLRDDFTVSLQMAKSHAVSDDGLTHAITLREGLKFHNGADVTAQDVAASILRWTARASLASGLKDVLEDVIATDPATVIISLRKPYPLLPDLLARPQNACVIIPAAQAASGARLERPVGSGPYRMVWDEWVQGARVVFERFADYQPRPADSPAEFTAGAKIARVERIEWLIVPDAATAVTAMQTGEVDGLETVSQDFVSILRAFPDVTLQTNAVPTIPIMRFNQLQAPFNDAGLRRAILPAISQTSFMNAIGATPDNPAFNMATGAFAPHSPMSNDRGLDALTGPRDEAAARQAVADAGYAGAEIVVVDVVSSPLLHACALVGADLLTKLGFTVKLEPMDWGAALQKREDKSPVSEGGWSVMFTALVGINTFDPVGNLGLRATGAQGWFGWPESERLESLRNAWMQAEDQAERVEIAGQIQQQMFVDVPYIPLGSVFTTTAMANRWTGLSRYMPMFYALNAS